MPAAPGWFSAQLAVFAATPIDRRMCDRLVAFRLATHARACAGKRLASPFRDPVTAIFALVTSLAARHASSGGANGVTDGVVDLLLYRAIS
jgi:hypothetical protein